MRRPWTGLRGAAALVIALAALAAAPLPARAADLLVFAAASTEDVIPAIGRAFEAKGGARVRASFASSGILARQIENGAPASVFVSANREWVDYLARKGRLVPHSRRIVARNRLVMVAPVSRPRHLDIRPGVDLKGALGGGRLAIADPAHVPAGMYARQALKALGLWRGVADSAARAVSVRAALVLVERGESPLGIVYATDAAASARVMVAGRFPEETHEPIVYEAALVAGQEGPAAARFLAFLVSPEAAALFRARGFEAE